MDVREKIIFDTDGGRRIEDRAKEGTRDGKFLYGSGGRENEGIKFLRLSCRF